MFIYKKPSIAPTKIVSLVPSVTELLYDLGLENETVGITKFCIHPKEWFKTKTKIGGTKNINIERIIALKPDLIICSKEENIQAQVNTLVETLPVYLTDVCTYEDALQMILDIGAITNKTTAAKNLVQKINHSFRYDIVVAKKKYKTAYLIWHEPYMTIGGDTFIHDMMQKIGLENVYKNETRYPSFVLEELILLKPDVVLLSSEPYPFKDKHIHALTTHLPNTKICLADGEMFSWYGSRMLYAAEYFKRLMQQIETSI
jgi:ABC-type Fe3+-hydroxamate transport system substrate-binding protein